MANHHVRTMTTRAFATQAKRARSLRGHECSRAQSGYARALMLDFGSLSEPDAAGYRKAQRTFVAECPWRLENPREVIVGSGDEEGTIDTRLRACVGGVVSRVEIYTPSYTIRLRLGDLLIWIFPDDARHFVETSEYPRSPWYLSGSEISEGWE